MNKHVLQLPKVPLLSRLNFQSSSARVIANLFSRAVVALAGIVFVPIYIRLIGVESYGLVAFYGTLSGALIVLDLGLSTAISRQVAILNAQPDKKHDLRNLVFSVEIIYWAIALVVGLVVFFLANPIAVYWVKAKDLPVPVIEKAVRIMGLVFALQFPASIYNGVMIGLEKQIPNALATALSALVKAFGAVTVLLLIRPTIEWYFIWQAISVGLFTLFLRYLTKRYTASDQKAVFSKTQLQTVRNFAAGMMGISLITFFLGQADKIVVSKLVLLEFVGYYNLAFMLASMLTQIISPLQSVVFPRFATLVATNQQEALIRLYHKSCRWVAIVIFPVGFTLVFFAKEILFFWTKNPTLVEHTAPILQTFTVGTMCNCIMWMPYFFMLAKGNTRFTIYQNIIASVILVPLLFWWTGKYGAFGASLVWLCVNAGYIVFSLPLFHRLFMKGELFNWLKDDAALPLLSSGILLLGAKLLQTFFLTQSFNIFYFGALLSLAGVLYLFLIPELRKFCTALFLKK
ncbi:lipopolysaccharide biosynthesis protein [Flavisolibacter ginsenosidimutans]|uniref:lipopolysaccharide biosynthesis protein n=1 Tax=Flavisolibacter ginsenosidimutans TaxID=661481 RepID=UPI00155AF3F1|nr:oligosaccharide flippase family protein [Flavisolibacter ginsenosidimutans]